MVWQFREDFVSFFETFSVGQLDAVSMLVDEPCFLGELEGSFGCSLPSKLSFFLLPRLYLLFRFLLFWFLLLFLLLELLGRQLNSGLLGVGGPIVLELQHSFDNLGLHRL